MKWSNESVRAVYPLAHFVRCRGRDYALEAVFIACFNSDERSLPRNFVVGRSRGRRRQASTPTIGVDVCAGIEHEFRGDRTTR
jgi:hypothetical protein